MRDIIWTVIVIWIVWKIYDAYKNISKTKTQKPNQGFNGNPNNRHHQKEGEVNIDKNVDTKSHYNPADAEYIDYEEVK